jgi:ribosome maturation factor RimP
MTLQETLTNLIEPEAQALGFDLVRVKLFGGDDATLQIMAERPDTRQLTIEDCAALSRRISEKLDILEEAGKDPIEGAYRLEVSSPGIDRPLTRERDFVEWAGFEAKITLIEKRDGRQRFNGELLGVDAAGDIIVRDKEDLQHSLPFALIESAKLALTDRLIAETARLGAAPSAEGAEEIIENDIIDEEG